MPRLLLAAGGGGSGLFITPEESDMTAYINVTESPYLATGNGSTDDTAAIQAAVDDHKAAGATIYFPAGEYKITATIDVDPVSASSGYLRFLGDGGGDQPASKITMATSNTTAFKSNANLYDTTFERLWIHGPGGASSGAGLWGNERNIHTMFTRVDGFYYGVREGPQSYYSKHIGSLFYQNAAGIWYEAGANNGLVLGCRLSTNGYGLLIHGAQSMKVIGGAIEANTNFGILVDTNGGQTTYGTTIEGAYFENNGNACIYLGDTGEVRSTTISGCFFTSPQTGYFIDMEQADYTSVIGCGFLGSPTVHDMRGQAGATHIVLVNNRPSGAGNAFSNAPSTLP